VSGWAARGISLLPVRLRRQRETTIRQAVTLIQLSGESSLLNRPRCAQALTNASWTASWASAWLPVIAPSWPTRRWKLAV
jgi:hypothetical protein